MSDPGADAVFALPLSADTPEALDELRLACAAFLTSQPDVGAAALLHSASRRRQLPWRAVALGSTALELCEALKSNGDPRVLTGGPVGDDASWHTAWVLAGCGSVRPAMGHQLYAHTEPFRQLLDECRDRLLGTWDVDLRKLLLSDVRGALPTHLAEIALAGFELGLVEVWRRCTPSPALVAGRGLGGLTALGAAGALSDSDTLHLIAAYGHLTRTMPSGALDAVHDVAADLSWRPLATPLALGWDGTIMPAGATVGPEYVVEHARGTYRIDAVLTALAAAQVDYVVDFDVHATTLERYGQLRSSASGVAVQSTSCEPLASVAQALARAFCDAVGVDMAELLSGGASATVRLPTTPLPTRRIWPEASPSPVAPPSPEPVDPKPAIEPLTAPAASGERLRAIVETIREHAAQELGVEPSEVSAETTFFDLGADSLLMVNVLRHVEQTFDVCVTMRELFEDGDSPIALARLVESRMVKDAVGPPPEVLAQVVRCAPPAPAVSTADEPPGVARDKQDRPAETGASSHGPRILRDPDGSTASGPITAAQREHLDRLVAAFTARTRRSKELTQRFRPRLADCRAVTGFRTYTKEMLYPIATRSARGARVEDVDGNSYVDITMGFGALLFGHEPSFVREAVTEHLARGIQLGSRTEDTGVAAELLCELVGAERVAFATSGTEAISAAIRLARAATGRDTIVMFRDSYHGHFDTVLARGAGHGERRVTVPVSIGIPQSAVRDVVVLDYDEEASLEEIARRGEQLAAVLVEPVQSRHPDRQPKEFLARLRALTEQHGTVLIFDEMLTGFRSHLGGAQAVFGVRADLATYGKVLGGGFPIGAIAGRSDLMDRIDGGSWRYGDDSRPECETTFFAGTYMQHPVAMAAARAVLEHLKAQGPMLQEGLNARTEQLAARLNAHFAHERYPLRVAHFGSLFRFVLERDLDLLFSHLVLKGVFLWEWRNFHLSTAHTDGDVAHVEDAVVSSLAELRAAGWLPGEPRSTSSASRPSDARPAARTGRFSVYYFGSYPRETKPEERYELLFESARFADQAGFHALWLPERHFHAFGGIFPNPSVLAAALARETEQIRLHAGSVVLPLHDPIRVAEEWSVVDNLSSGRVGIGVASGWHANDFALRPEAYGRHKDVMYESLATVKALWRGEAVAATSGSGEAISLTLHPPPLQPHPPLFTAIVGDPNSYRRAGANDLGVITNLMTQDVEQLAANVAIYREARAAAGLDPAAGSVVVLLHTYLAGSEEQARADAFEPFCTYLRSSLSLFGQVTNSLGMSIDLDQTPEDDIAYMLERAFERYCDTRALIGTVDSSAAIVERVLDAGADEIACFVDFGVSLEQVRESLPRMAALRERFQHDGAARALVEPAPTAPDLVEDSGPLSLTQERIWFTEQLHTGQRAYNEPRVIRLEGELDTPALSAALNDVVRSQPMLRTRIAERDGAAYQWVRRHADVELDVVDAAGRLEEDVVAEEMAHESARRFDLVNGPLWLVRLVRLGEHRHVLVISFHHIIFDAFSAKCLARELSRCYAARRQGVKPPPPPEHRSYTEYVRLQRQALEDPDTERDLQYWRECLTPLPSPLELPPDRARPARPTGEGSSVFHRLDHDLTARVAEAARACNATPSMCLTAAFAVVLRAMCGQDDVLIGTVVSDQPIAFADTIGLFLNTLALRIDLGDATDFAAAVGCARAALLDVQEHQSAPFEELVRRLNPPRDPSRNPLFGVTIEFEAERAFGFSFPGIVATDLDVAPSKSPFDLTLFIAPRGEEVSCQFEYATALYERATIEQLAASFEAVLRTALEDLARPLTEVLARVADADPQLARIECGRVLELEPAAQVVSALVTEHARRAPDAVAIEAADGSPISFARLDARAEQLAHVLADRGVQQGSAVMLALPQDPRLVVAMIAVLKLGAAYVPIDPRTPDERKALIAADCAPVALVGPAVAETAWCPQAIARVMLDEHGDPPGITGGGAGPARAPHVAEMPAYVLYTSGSTGRPKGVVMPYAGLANLVAWHREVHRPARTLQYASPGFDVATQEIVGTLATGGTVVTIAPETRYDSGALARVIAQRRIQQLHIPATPLRYLLDALPEGDRLPDLCELLVGGEQLLLTERMRAFLRANPQLTLVNEYGPTETHAVTRRIVPLDEDAHVSIGAPVANMAVRILDRDGRRVLRGAVGELCVAGPQVANGYRRPVHDRAQVFGQDPYAPEPRRRLYRTGDLARWRHDGALLFVGRTDDQMKVRGNRVEPGEVEATLRSTPLVADVAVLPWTDRNGERSLAAYVVPANAALDDRELLAELRQHVVRHLPSYMIPAAWSLLTRLPTNASNKLDRQALPEPTIPGSDMMGEQPTSEAEAAIRDIWCAELGLDDIDVTRSFFDVGGHSLNAVSIVSRVNERFGIEYPILDFFRQPTVRATALAIDGNGTPE